MNALANRLLRILQNSPLGDMSEHLLLKQANDSGLDLNRLKVEQLDTICVRFEKILPFFIGNKTAFVIEKIKTLKEDESNHM